MTKTHKWELVIAENKFEGECEYSNAGLVSFNETSEDLMSDEIKEAVRKILSFLGPLPTTYTDLTKFELVIDNV